MKKIVFLLLSVICLPVSLWAQSNGDDLYFVPSKKEDKQEKAEPAKKQQVVNRPVTQIYTSPGTTVIVRDSKGNVRDVDEYNRRYRALDNDFSVSNDTLYIDEKPGGANDLQGEWINGFDGSQSDYEYATRIIRFHHPRYAISISSPLYFDIVYGIHSWDWNIYTDGWYAYAFPTFSNPLWWDWRWNTTFSWGWGWPYTWGWNYGLGWPHYYAWNWGYNYWGGWGAPHYRPHYGWGNRYYASHSVYSNRRTTPRYSARPSAGREIYRHSSRVNGARYNDRSRYSTTNRYYTRPSNTRVNTSTDRRPTYNTGSSSSNSPLRNYSLQRSSRVQNRVNNNRVERTYSPTRSNNSGSYNRSSSGSNRSGGGGGSVRSHRR